MAKKTTTPTWNPFRTAEGADASPANELACEIVAERRDLLPSIEWIMNAGLDDERAATALGLFRTALSSPGDPNRDPRTAVSAVGGGKSASA